MLTRKTHEYYFYMKALFAIFLAIFSVCAHLEAQTQKIVDIEVYIENGSHYYYSYNYLRKALRLDGFRTSVQSLSKFRLNEYRDPATDHSLKQARDKIYLIVVSQNRLESYQQVLECFDRQCSMILWVLNPEGFTPLPANFDVTTSASTKDDFLQVFRAEILPQIISRYTKDN